MKTPKTQSNINFQGTINRTTLHETSFVQIPEQRAEKVKGSFIVVDDKSIKMNDSFFVEDEANKLKKAIFKGAYKLRNHINRDINKVIMYKLNNNEEVKEISSRNSADAQVYTRESLIEHKKNIDGLI